MTIKKCIAAVLIAGFVTIVAMGGGKVKVWQEPLVLPTYKIAEPDTNPRFYNGRVYQGAQGRVYPYAMSDALTSDREDQAYKALYVENEYVKVCFLPEIGGRLFSAIDKTNNYDFFYRQSVIKPALIGMLGAWISGGIEWCIPHHHRASTYMPVDYTLVENPDGSKTIWVGEMELRHRMQWILGATLYPDKSYIEVTVKISNRTPFTHSILYWANVAVHSGPDYRVIYPPSTQFVADHAKRDFARWPISHEVYRGVDYTKGVDVSWEKSHIEPTSMFAFQSKEDFIAGYDFGNDAGVVHFANHNVVPGKKFWTWGVGENGKIWERVLTDSDGPYTELMVGSYSDDQPDYSWIQPYEVKVIKQYWYPIQKIQGVKNANRQAAVNLEVADNTAEFGFNATSKYDDARVLLRAGDKVIFEKVTDISPAEPFYKRIDLPVGVKETDLEAVLLSSDNQELVSYKPVKVDDNSPMPDRVTPPAAPEEIKTTEELYLAGLRLQQFYNSTIEPEPYYLEALKRDPGDSRVNTVLGMLDCKRGLFKEAEEKLNLAIERITKDYTRPLDGKPHYYLGVALNAQGRYAEAYDAFYRASWNVEWHSASYFALSQLDCRKGDFATALEHIEQAVSTNTVSAKLKNLRATILRKLGESKAAHQQAVEVAEMNPLDFQALNELYLAQMKIGRKNVAKKTLSNLKEKMRDEAQSYLELALDYGNCGLWDSAIDVLARQDATGGDKGSTHPMLYYYLGFYYQQKGDSEKALKYYKYASGLSHDYCFPFRLESIDVLRAAAKANPADARVPYYLGNLLYEKQPEAAIKEWEKARSLDLRFAMVHRNLGLAYYRTENDSAKAIRSYETAISYDKSDPRVFYELDLFYERAGVSPEKRLALLEANSETVEKRDDAFTRKMQLYVQTGNFDKAIDVFDVHYFRLWEGGDEIRYVYVNAMLLRGNERFNAGNYKAALADYLASNSYPENQAVRKRLNDRADPQINYCIGQGYEKTGDDAKARIYYEKAVDFKRAADWPGTYYYMGMAYKKLGQADKAKELFGKLESAGREILVSETSMDFFAKFGEQQTKEVWKASGHYLIGLAKLGKGERGQARAEFEKAVDLNVNHLWAVYELSLLK